MLKRLFHAFVMLLASASAAHAASFDCKLARSKAETMICADAHLSTLDERLDAAYTQARKTSVDANAEKARQLAWLKSRNACADAVCLARAYESRITELRIRSPGASPLAGVWKKEYSCDGVTGIYKERCEQGERNMFELAVAVSGERVCVLHVVWANMGNRIDEVEDTQPSMTGTLDGKGGATVRFRSTWGGTGTATLRVEGNALHWKVDTKDKGESWIPDEATLPRDPAQSGRLPSCGQ